MKVSLACIVTWVLVMGALALPAHASFHVGIHDYDLVSGSELIVVGRLKQDPVIVTPHPQNGAMAWNTHATLLISEVIKGKCREKELPIVIRYGVDVESDGKPVDFGKLTGPTTLPAPTKTMSIVASGLSGIGVPPVEEVQKDHLWFLYHSQEGEWGPDDDKGYGIGRSEAVQPMRLRGYFESYLAADAEAAVRAAMQKEPELAERALPYLQHRQIGWILQEKNAAVRVERLLPYFRNGDWEAREGLIAAGEIAGPYLMAVYAQSEEWQDDVVQLWGKTRYKGCVATLIEILKREDEFWAEQKGVAGWWNNNTNSPLTIRAQRSYSLVYHSAYALGQIGDPRAREALELTRKRWVKINNVENPQIVEACEGALGVLGPEKKK